MNFIHTIPINCQVENTCDFVVTRWNATYGFEILKFLGDMVDNGDASIRVQSIPLLCPLRVKQQWYQINN